VTVAGDALKSRGWPRVGLFPMDCPYCAERLDHAHHGWVCRRCRSTVGAECGIDQIEEGLR
jgi:hypothetical protein